MSRLNVTYFIDEGTEDKIQIQPMLRLNCVALVELSALDAIQIQPMLRLNVAKGISSLQTYPDSNTTNVKVKPSR